MEFNRKGNLRMSAMKAGLTRKSVNSFPLDPRIQRALELMEAVAKKLTHYDPDNAQWWISWAFATRRADSIEAARRILLKAVEQHFDVAVVPSVVLAHSLQL